MKLDESIGFLLARTHHKASSTLLQALKPYALTPEQWAVLKRLWEEDGVSQKELAARTSKDQPTTARILEKMQRKGLVARECDPSDGRASLVYLTPKGREIRDQVIPAADKALEKVLTGFSPDEVQELRDMLNRIYRNLV